MNNIKEGDYVKIIGNAPGTVWETGYIANINDDGYLIKYGRPGMGGLYGLGINKQAEDLEPFFEEICHQCGEIKLNCMDDMKTNLGNPGFVCYDCYLKGVYHD